MEAYECATQPFSQARIAYGIRLLRTLALMSFTVIGSTVACIAALIGAFLGAKWIVRIVVAVCALWFLAFLIAAGLQSEPGTTVLGWGMVLVLPMAVLAIVVGVIAAGLANSWRSPPSQKAADES